MRYSSAVHTRFYHRFHVVWITKYCYKVLQGPVRERICEIIVQTCAEMGGHIVHGVLGRDHVHMFLSIPPKLALFNVMQRIKGRSSGRIQIWSALSCASVTGEDAFGSEFISQPPLEMSLTISSRSIWNYIPLNDATDVSR